MKTLLLSLLFLAGVAQADTLIEDKFTSDKLPQRKMMRGEWKIADSMAVCTQDDELFKKNKDHGPVTWYDVNFTDGTVKFAFRPQGSKSFVFTLNNEKGHVFRFLMSNAGLAVRAWPTQGHEAKPSALLNPKPGSPALKDGEWVPVELKFEGPKCAMKIGTFSQTFENAAIAFDKTTIGLGFSFGTLAVKDVLVTKP